MNSKSPALNPIQPRLSGSIRLVLPRLPGILASEENLQRIRQQASLLPAIHLAGFEYQFGSRERGLDFQQGLPVTQETLKTLTQYCSREDSDANPHQALIGSLRKYFDHCLNPQSALFGQVKQLWLEFDCGLGEQERPAAIFIALHDRLAKPEVVALTIQETFEHLAGTDLDLASLDSVATIINAAATVSGTSNVGFMAGRPGSGIRLVMPAENQVALAQLITTLKPEAPAAAMAASIEGFQSQLPDYRLCVDVQRDLIGNMALECFFPEYRPGDDYRKIVCKLLNRWADAGWCNAAEADCLQTWAGEIYPTDQTQHWPDDLLLKSLGGASSSFIRIQCGFSHIKLADWSDGWQKRKIYFGFRESALEMNGDHCG